jgi:hypothetical protein
MSRKLKIAFVAVACLAALLVWAIPALKRARVTAASNFCINNLQQIDAAKHNWAHERGKTTNDVPTWDDIRPFLGYGTNVTKLVCPDGGTYTIGRIDESPRCSVPGHSLP